MSALGDGVNTAPPCGLLFFAVGVALRGTKMGDFIATNQ